MASNQFYVTKEGKRMLAAAQAGEVLGFSKVSLGDGEPLSLEFMEEMTGLISPKDSFPVNSVKNNGDGTVSIECVLDNSDVEERYFIREIGLYAKDPTKGEVLYAVCSCGDAADLFSSKSDKALSIVLEIRIEIGNAKNVTFILDDSLVWVTRKEVYNLAGEGRTDETVKKNADDILALKLKFMVGGITSGLGSIDKNTILVSFKDLQEDEEFWGYWDSSKARLVG